MDHQLDLQIDLIYLFHFLLAEVLSEAELFSFDVVDLFTALFRVAWLLNYGFIYSFFGSIPNNDFGVQSTLSTIIFNWVCWLLCPGVFLLEDAESSLALKFFLLFTDETPFLMLLLVFKLETLEWLTLELISEVFF